MIPVLVVLALLAPVSFASTTPSCLNVTLPGILNLGQCFGTSLNLCSVSTSGVTTGLTKLLSCLITGLTSINPLGAVSALSGIVTLVLNLSGLGFLVGLVPNIPGLTLLSGNTTCSTPISLTLPDTMNLGKCVSQSLPLCQSGAPATNMLLQSLISTLTCLLTTLLGSNPGGMLTGVGCTLVGLLQAAPGLGFVASALKTFLGCT